VLGGEKVDLDEVKNPHDEQQEEQTEQQEDHVEASAE